MSFFERIRSYFTATRPSPEIGLQGLVTVQMELSNTGLFDQAYYLSRYPDVQQAGITPFEHFIQNGFFENRVPSLQAENLSRQELQEAMEKAGVSSDHFKVVVTRKAPTPKTEEPADYLKHFKTIAQLGPANKASLFNYLEQLFDLDEYVEDNSDLQSTFIDPKLHFFKSGYYEQRLPCKPENLDRKIKQLLTRVEYLGDPVCQEYRHAPRRQQFESEIIVSYSTKGNFFFQEIAECLHQGLVEAGYQSTLASDQELRPDMQGHLLVVAPHEYFGFKNGKTLYGLVRSTFPHRTYYVTEQPQSKFGLNQLQYLFDGANILDINLASCLLTRKINVRSYFLPIGPLKSERTLEPVTFNRNIDNIFIDKSVRDYDIKSETAIAQRPLDVLYVANSSQRRDEFLAAHSSLFNRHKSFIFAPFWPVPHKTDSSATLDINNCLALCQRSKLLLNIHRDEFHYFEWHRIFSRALKCGNVVISEPMYAIPGLVSGYHYLEYPIEDIPEKIVYLLNTREGRALCETVSRNARAVFESWEPLSISLDAFFKYCENV